MSDGAPTDDLSALAWVHDELRRSLEAANKALRRFVRDHEAVSASDIDAVDPAVLRNARTQIHQGVGALELIGQPAAAAVLAASETLIDRYVARPHKLTAAMVDDIERSSFALLDYLSRLLAGKSPSPLSLFPRYRAVLEAAGAERVHPADLWVHDWQWRALPADRSVLPLQPAGAAQAAFEAQLLPLMRALDPKPTAGLLGDLCAGLGAGATDLPVATLWQLAAAMFEAQTQGLLGFDVFSKRVASRLLAQFRAFARGVYEVPDRLGQDLLFFCAQSAIPADPLSAPRLHAVREAYGLGAGLPVDYATTTLGRFDPALVTQAKKRVVAAKDAWSGVAGGELHRLSGLGEQFTLVAESLKRLFPHGEQFALELQQAVTQTQQAGAAPPAALAMEVATSLLYVEAALDDIDFDHPEQAERVARLAARLAAVRSGRPPEALEGWMEELYRRVSDRQTMGSVVQELRTSLAEAEKPIDAYFRDPTRREVLIPVRNTLASMRGVLTVLGMDHASAALQRMRDEVDELAATEVDVAHAAHAGRFERLAGNLGALGFLIDMLSVQPAMAKSLFEFDVESGSLHPVMGRTRDRSLLASDAAAAAPAVDTDLIEQAQRLAFSSVREDVTTAEVTRDLGRLSEDAHRAAQATLASTVDAARDALVRAGDSSTDTAAVRGALSEALVDFVASTSQPVGLDLVPSAGAPATPADADPALDDEMREVFLEEAREVLADAATAQASLRESPDDIGLLTTLRRAFHTLKGSSRMVGLKAFGEAAWTGEQLYNTQLAEQSAATPGLLDFTAWSIGYLGTWVDDIAAGRDGAHDAATVEQAARQVGAPTVDEPRVEPAVAPLAAAVPFTLPTADELDFTDGRAMPAAAPEVAPSSDPYTFDLDALEPAETDPASVAAMPFDAGSMSPSFDLDLDFDLTAAAPPTAEVDGRPSTFELEPAALLEPFDSAPTEPLPLPEAIESGWDEGEVGSVDLEFDLDLPAEPPSVPAVAVEAEPEAAAFAESYAVLGDDLQPPVVPETGSIAESVGSFDSASDFSVADPGEALAAWAAEPALEAKSVELPPAPAEATFDETYAVLGEPTGAESSAVESLPITATPDTEAPIFALDTGADASVDGLAAEGLLTAAATPSLEVAPEAVAEVAPVAVFAAVESTIAADEAPATPVAAAARTDDEPFKLVGPLRISAPLFNIYLSEADELSRRLLTEVIEWSGELHRPVGEIPIALAHSLAGNSATVGYVELSQLARSLESALTRSHKIGSGTSEEARLFVDAAEEIRGLLHQFAAGFLRQPSDELLRRLSAQELSSSARLDAELSDAVDAPVPELEPVAVEAEPVEVAAVDTEPAIAEAGVAIDASMSMDAEPAGAEPAEAAELEIAPIESQIVEPEPETVGWMSISPTEEIERSDAALPEAPDAALEPPVVASVEPVEPRYDPLGVVQFKPLTELSEEAPRTQPNQTPIDADDSVDAVDAIDAELFPIFQEEAEELLPQLASRLREWYRRPGDAAVPAACMRTLHTLKGGARLAGAMRLGEMAHQLETRIERLAAAESMNSSDVEALLVRSDALAHTFEALKTGEPDRPAAPPPALAAPLPTIAEPSAPMPEATLEPTPEPSPEPMAEPTPEPTPAAATAANLPQAVDWSRFALTTPGVKKPAERAQGVRSAVRVPAPVLDRLVNQAGEVSIARSRIESGVVQLKTSLGDLTDNLERLRSQLRDIEIQGEVQMSSRLEAAKAASQSFDPLELDRFTRFQELTRMMAESVNDVATVQRSLQRSVEIAEDELAAQARMTHELQDSLLRTRMVEFEGLSDRLYRVVRQTAKETGRSVRLDIVGGSVEVDRGVLDRMTGAFEHLLRNAVGHGIEAPEVRVAAGKEATGAIVVVLTHEGNEVGVEFRDDGAGLDLARIRAKALAIGLLTPGQEPSDGDLANLIFEPGFTTADAVTEVAGRGVGMDVVRSDVQAMGGRIETATSLGRGTSFKLVLPLTTAVTQVVMLRCGDTRVAVPSALVEAVRRATVAEVDAAHASGSYPFGERTLQFFWLGALLQTSPRSSETDGRTRSVVIVRSAQQRIAVQVDEVIGNQEVVVKNLGPQLSRLPGLAGISLLASGEVALIYNPVALATLYGDAAREATSTAGGASAAAPSGPAPKARASGDADQGALVMVVDDSLTVRRVTQRMLLREGYRVLLAKDGLEALELLADNLPEVVLSDIEMPRMDGFDLVRNLRSQTRLRSLPVIMITSRIAQKHREYAAELGVDHYLGKPYSEEDLLALIARYTTDRATVY